MHAFTISRSHQEGPVCMRLQSVGHTNLLLMTYISHFLELINVCQELRGVFMVVSTNNVLQGGGGDDNHHHTHL